MQQTIPVYSICNLLDEEELRQSCVVLSLNSFLAKQPKSAKPHRHSFYQVLLITKGSGKHIIDFNTYDIQAGDLYFLAPGQVHTWLFSKDAEGYIINFDVDFFSAFLAKNEYIREFSFFMGNHSYAHFLLKEQYASVTAIFEKLKATYLTVHAFKNRDLLKVYLLELFLLCDQLSNQKRTASQQMHTQFFLIQHFERLIERQYLQKRLPKEYADELCVTPNYLNASCKKVKGVSAGQLIRDRVLLECKRLLVNSDMTVSEIAYHLDFKDNSYFSRFFKKYVGCTPLEFQKKHH